MANKVVNVILGILFALFVITFAIGVPILFRPFYYWHIDWLKMTETTGYSYATIKNGYDSVMNYLLFGGEFSLGEFAFSESGKAHFVDCRPLFLLDLSVLVITSLFFIVYIILRKKGIAKKSYKKYSPYFISSIGIMIIFVFAGIWGAIDFEGLFTAFHHVCFPGKDNWLFDPSTDPIIEILPEEFWLHAGIVIAVIILAICISIIIRGIIKNKRANKIKAI